MTFIGIVAQKNSVCNIKRYINNNLFIKPELIYINNENIENIKNVTFETILIVNTKEINSKLNVLKVILQKAKYILINADIKENMQILRDLDLKVITYGFNNKSTITASSVEGENALICVQRNILGNNNQQIEPQEVKININGNKNITEIMGVIGVLLIYNNQKMEKIYKI